MAPGHVFIINGDLTKIACDALLIPTDGVVNITPSWREFLRDKTYPAFFRSRVMPAVPTPAQEPHVWLGNLGQSLLSWTFSAFEETLSEFAHSAVAALKEVSKGSGLSLAQAASRSQHDWYRLRWRRTDEGRAPQSAHRRSRKARRRL